ncbi:MAG: site-2 protease family protein [Acidimicrobiia bacterium]|nr:site-2 protease family protein [Acidimicrobiia bacterium]
MNALDTAARRAAPIRPSPLFLLVVAATAFGGWLCIARPISDGVAVFVFVLAGWILSLILHEFAHAYTAWRGGDLSVASKGYLSLDPRLYADPLTSIALPLLFLVMGGLGLPGGAVWINRRALRSPLTASLVSLAGPTTNLVFAAACLLPLANGLVNEGEHPVLAPALAFLGFLQVVAFVLNMLPVPGLDGYGALEPHLPRQLQELLAPLRRWGILILIGVLFYVEPARDAFWDTIISIVDAFSVSGGLALDGWDLFRFWR